MAAVRFPKLEVVLSQLWSEIIMSSKFGIQINFHLPKRV